MNFTELWEWVQAHPTSQYIGFTWWFPFLESIHVIAITLVVGSILVVDLRLLGISGLQYSASRITRELIPWTWGAFFVAPSQDPHGVLRESPLGGGRLPALTGVR